MDVYKSHSRGKHDVNIEQHLHRLWLEIIYCIENGIETEWA